MKIKFLLVIPFLPCLFQLFLLFFVHFDDRFHPASFEHGFKSSYSVQVVGLNLSQVDDIVKQPFHYLGMGKQMVALESEDGKTVLKLFNPMRPLKKNWVTQWKYWRRYNSLKWIFREWFQRNARLKKLFIRHKISFETLQSETGLLFVHLAPSEKINYLLHLTDNRGKKHILNLKNTPFVLQEKAILVPQYITGLLEKGNLQEAKEAVASLEHLFEKRSREGITDRIQTMENNYGFVGNKPIQIDVGRIRVDPLVKKNPTADYDRILGNFHQWIRNKYPVL